jgi:deoxyribonuclease IV
MTKYLGFSINFPSGNKIITEIITNTNNFNCIQVFFDSNNLNEKILKKMKKIFNSFTYIFVHSSYKINIGSNYLINNDDVFYNTSYELLLKEIKYSYLIGASGIVIHIGENTQMKYNNDIIYNNMVTFILQLFSTKIITSNFNIIFETSSGQRGQMLYDLKEFVDFILLFKKYDFYDKIAVCIDTCHIFQAGYDLNNDKIIKKVHKIFDKIKDKIKLIHLNDSYHPVGKHIDRHQNIGEGFIQTKNLIKFVRPYKNIPMIFEVSNIFSSYDNLHKN